MNSVIVPSKITILKFRSYNLRKGEPKFMPVNGDFVIETYSDLYRKEDECDNITMWIDPISIKLSDNEVKWLSSLFVTLDDDRTIRTRDPYKYNWINLGKMPEFKTPEEALSILEKFLQDRLA